MARFPYTKLNAKVNQEVLTIDVEGNVNPIEVRQYLPIDEKLGLIGRVIELAHDGNNFSNPLKLGVYYSLEMIQAYTNIVFTEKQKETPTKLYDSLLSSGWLDKIFANIPSEEKSIIYTGLMDTVDNYYKYRNSILGVIDNISTDYSDLEFDIEKLGGDLSNPENIALLKNIMGRLG